MRSYRHLFFSALAILLLPGCQKDIPGAGNGLPMQLAPTLAGETRGSLTTADLTDFYLQVVSDDAAYSYFEHASKGESGAWTTPTALQWKNEQASITYCAARLGAYSFTADDFKNGVKLKVPSDQRTQEQLNAADLLTMAAAGRKFADTADGTLPVALSHGLAKLSVTLTLGPEFYENYYGLDDNPVQDFMLHDVTVGFQFQPQTGAVTASGTKADMRPLASSFSPAGASGESAQAIYELILVPQDFAAGKLNVTFSVDQYEYAWSNSSDISLAAGMAYDLEVSVSDAPSQNVPYVKMGDGLRWATCNVGADSETAYGEYYAWAEVATKTSYDQSSYRWRQPGIDLIYNITKYTFDDGNAYGANWYSGDVFVGDGKIRFADYVYADDPARQNWGRSWRTPTLEEWQWLIDNCTWEWQADYKGSGKKGMLVTSQAPGYVGNCIFLPAAGYLRSESYYSYETGGFYWSSALFEGDVTKAWHLDFGATSDPVEAASLRYRGFSIRPVCN